MTIPRPRAPRTSPRAGAFTPRPLLLAILTGLGSLGQPALANPVNPTVVAGNATFATVGKTLSVTNSNGAIINWQGFSIGQNEITRFIQASASSQVLNRVVGGDPSIILGQLQSNGRVFLVNPNGVVFGASARVDVAGLVASTLNISNEDFLGNRLVFQAAPGAGALGNAGQIRVQDGGQVLLIGTSVSNSGLIEAPNGDVVLAAGQKVSLVDINRPDIEYRVDAPANKAVNLGQIRAGRIGAYAGSIDAGGTLEAGMAVVGQNGRIILKARDDTLVSGTLSAGNGQQGGEVQVLGRRVALQESARIDASGSQGGGTVLVGGAHQGKNPEVQNAQFTDVAATAQIRADATQAGDGGKVIVWSDDTTRMAGSISARGGTMGGNGGFAEISGKAHVQADGHADLSAPGGKAGTLLLDPGSITVSAGASNAATGIVNNGWVNTQLNTSSLILATTDGGLTTNGATQDITVSAPISWSNANTLTLNAGNNIAINSTITSTGGNLALNATGTANIASTIALAGGTLQGTGLTVNGTSATLTGVTLDADLAVKGSGYLYLNGGLTFANSGHTLSLGGAAAYGRLIYNGTQSILGNGNISFAATNGYTSYIYGDGTGATLTLGPNISLSGTASASMAYTQLGNYANDSIILQGTLTADQANRTFTTYGSFTNAGTLNVSAGAFNLGTSGTWSNAGATVNLSGGTLTLGNFNTANAGSIAQTGGSASLTGTATNTGNTWNITTTGLTALNLAGTVTGGTLQGTGLIVNGGSATFTGVTLDTNLSVLANGYLYLNGGLTFANSGRTLSLGGAASYGRLVYNGTQSILGNGNISFAATNGNYSYIYGDGTGATLTLGSGIALSGTASGSMAYTQLGNYANDSIIVQGTLTADQANRTFTTYGSFTNAGTLNVSAGVFNLGTSGTWSNAGATVNLSGGTLTLGNFNTANAGSIAQTGGSASLTGTATNTGNTWNITATGLTALNLAGTVTGGTLQGTGLTVNGGSATFTGVTLDTNLSVLANGYLYLNGGLTFANSGHILSIGGAASYGRLIYNGTQSILGNGNISFAATNGNYSYIYGDGTGATLTLGPNISLSGTASGSMAYTQLGNYANDSIIFQGTLTADQANRTFTTYGSFTNAGTLNVSAGVFNLGTSGTWSNAGATVNLSGGTLTLGNFNTANAGSIAQTGGSASLTGTATNTGNTWNITTTGLTALNLAGTVTGGTLQGTGLTVNGTSATLTGVTLDADLAVKGSGYLYLNGGLTFANSGHTLSLGGAASYGRLIYNGTQSILGNGNISFAATNGNYSYIYGDGTGVSLTLGPNISLSGTASGSMAYAQLGNYANDSIIFQGTLTADQANRTFSTYGNFTNAGTLNVSAGIFNLGNVAPGGLGTINTTAAGVFNLTGTLDLASGSLDIAPGGDFGAKGLGTLSGTIQNGTLTGTALTSSNGTLTNIIIGNSMTESGTLSIGQNLTLADGVDFNVGSSGLYFNAAAAGINLAAGATSASLTHTGTLYNNAGNNSGVVTIANGITVQGSGNLNNYYGGGGWVNNGLILNNTAAALNFNSPSFTNGATGIVSAVSGTTSLNPTTLNLLAGNTLNVAGGILNVIPTNAWTNSGNTTVSSGTLNLGGSFVLSSLGTYGRTGGTVNITGTLDLLNSLTPLNIASGGQFGTGGLGTLSGTIQNGTLTGAALTSSNGTLTNIIIGSSMTESGTLSIGQNLILADGVDFNVGSSGLYFNAAAAGINLAAGATSASLTHTGTLYNNAGNNSGVVTIANGITVQGSGNLNNYYGGGGWVNNGLILNNTAAALNFNSPSFTNGATGIVSAVSGTTSLNPTTLNLLAGNTLNVAGGILNVIPTNAWTNSGNTTVSSGTLNLGGSFVLSSLGTYGRTGGTVNITGTLDLLNSLTPLNIASGGQFGTGGLGTLSGTIQNGTLTGAALTSSNGTLTNIIIGSSMTESGTLSIGQNLILADGVDFNVGSSGLYFNAAAAGINLAAGATSASLTHTGTLYNNAGNNSGVVTIANGITVQGSGNLNNYYGGGGWVNNGLILNNTAAALNFNSPSFTNGATGSIEIGAAATVNASSTTFSNNGAIIISGGTLSRTTGSLVNPSGGTIKGYGTINMGANTFTNNGTVSVGDTAAPGTGMLGITGNFTQGSTGILNLDIAGRTRGSQYDALDISGAATLGGTLNVAHTGGFTAGAIEAMHVIHANSLSGTFASINQPGGYTPLYRAANMVLGIGITDINEWTNNTSGNWATTANWSLGHTPTATELAVIDRGASNPTITIGAAAGNVGSVSSWEVLNYGAGGSMTVLGPLTQTGSNLNISGGSLTSNEVPFIQTLALSSGTWTANGASTVRVLTQSGGNLAGTGTVTLTGTGSTWSGSTGTWAGGGTVHLNPGADLTLSGSGSGNTFAGRTLDIAAGATVTVSGEVEIDGGTNAITNAGTLNLTGSRISHIYNAGGSLTLTNSSIINKTGAGTFTLGALDFTNIGTTNVNAGTLSYAGGTGTSNGNFNVLGGATYLTSGATMTFGAASFFNSAGTLTTPPPAAPVSPCPRRTSSTPATSRSPAGRPPSHPMYPCPSSPSRAAP
jgi:filamentous hemagglutinin family protein